MTGDRAKHLAQLRQAYEDGILDEETYRAAIAVLKTGNEPQVVVNDSGAAAVGPGALAAAGGGVVIGGSVHEGPIVTGDRNVVEGATDSLRLPAECPNCGAPVRPDEVEWLSETTAACPHCGSTLHKRHEP